MKLSRTLFFLVGLCLIPLCLPPLAAHTTDPPHPSVDAVWQRPNGSLLQLSDHEEYVGIDVLAQDGSTTRSFNMLWNVNPNPSGQYVFRKVTKAGVAKTITIINKNNLELVKTIDGVVQATKIWTKVF